MYKSSLPFILCLLAFFNHFRSGSSILCYDCNSLYDPRCGDEFDPYHLGIVNCSLKDPLEHLPDLRPSICRSIRVDMEGKVRIIRKCGYLADENLNQPCQRKTSTDKMFTTYCSCDTDLCNQGFKETGFRCLWVLGILLVFQ